MNYSEVISKAWKILWKHKALWFFAFLAGSVASGSSNAGFRLPDRGSINWQNRLPKGNWGHWMQPFVDKLANIPPATWVLIALGILAFAFLVSLVGFFIGNIGKTGLIKGSLMADQAGTTQKLSIADIWNGLKPFYWRMILLHLVIGFGGFLVGVAFIAFLAVITIGTLGLALLCLLPLLLLLIPLNWLIEAWLFYAAVALVDDNLQIFDAIGKGWKEATQNLVPSGLMVLFTKILKFTAGVLIFFPFMLATAPVVVPAILQSGKIPAINWWIFAILILIVIVLSIMISILLNTFTYALLTITYKRLALKPTQTEILRTDVPAPEGCIEPPVIEISETESQDPEE